MVKAFKIYDALVVVTALMRAQQKHYHILPASLNIIGIKDGASKALDTPIKSQLNQAKNN
jgi:hypothetical protein